MKYAVTGSSYKHSVGYKYDGSEEIFGVYISGGTSVALGALDYGLRKSIIAPVKPPAAKSSSTAGGGSVKPSLYVAYAG